MICSILLPTRSRVKRLDQTLKSLYASADRYEFDILLAVDNDDLETIDYSSWLVSKFKNIQVFKDDRGRGWHDLHLRYTKLADVSKAPWVWMMNDDCLVSGQWIEALKNFPEDGVIVHPEIHRLGESIYKNDKTGGFPIVPNGCWRKFGFSTMGDPPDKFLNEECANQGWLTRYMKGVEISHQRIADEILPIERL